MPLGMHPKAFYTETTEKDYIRVRTEDELIELVIDLDVAIILTPKAADSLGHRLQAAAQEALGQ